MRSLTRILGWGLTCSQHAWFTNRPREAKLLPHLLNLWRRLSPTPLRTSAYVCPGLTLLNSSSCTHCTHASSQSTNIDTPCLLHLYKIMISCVSNRTTLHINKTHHRKSIQFRTLTLRILPPPLTPQNTPTSTSSSTPPTKQ